MLKFARKIYPAFVLVSLLSSQFGLNIQTSDAQIGAALSGGGGGSSPSRAALRGARVGAITAAIGVTGAKAVAAGGLVTAAATRVGAVTSAIAEAQAAVAVPPYPMVNGYGLQYVADLGVRQQNVIKLQAELAAATESAANAAKEQAKAAEDLANKNQELAEETTSIAEDVLNILEKVLFQSLKKKILDMIVDQIIGYIQGEGEPKFVTDWEGFLNDIVQGAVGDVTQALGLGFLCSPFSLQVRLSVALPPVDRFRTSFSCTLDQIVGNIENFYNDFRNGRWLAFDASFQPQNNYYGAIWLAWDAKQRTIASKAAAALNEAVSGGGFLGVKKCYDSAGNIVEGTSTGLVGTAAGIHCEIVTPGKALGDTVSKAIGSDIDFIVNAEDLSAYIAAITNALINRIIKEGFGLAGVSVPNAPQRIRTRPEINGVIYDNQNFPSGTRDTNSQWNTSQTDQLNFNYGAASAGAGAGVVGGLTKDQLRSQITPIRDARGAAQQALNERIALENSFISKLQEAKACQDARSDPSATTTTLNRRGYGYSFQNRSYWANLGRITQGKIDAERSVINGVISRRNENSSALDALNATLADIQGMTDAEFQREQTGIQTGLLGQVGESTTLRLDAERQLRDARTGLQASITDAQRDVDYCVRGY